jgi:hypothetical protein
MKTKLTPIYKLPFEQKFKWHGEKYIQIHRTKKCKIGMKVAVSHDGFLCEWTRFSSGRLVKPVIKCNI